MKVLGSLEKELEFWRAEVGAGAFSFFPPSPVSLWDIGLPLPPVTCQTAEDPPCLTWGPAPSPDPLLASHAASPPVHLGLLGRERMGPLRDPRAGTGKPGLSTSPVAGKGQLLQPLTSPRVSAGDILPSTTHFYASSCRFAFV